MWVPLMMLVVLGPLGAKGAQRCHVAPLRLVVEQSDVKTAVAELDASGAVKFGSVGQVQTFGKLDARGCLTSREHVLMELLPNGSIWTPRQVVQVRAEGIGIGPNRWMRIEADGVVRFLDENGSLAGDGRFGSFRVEGYGPKTACAATFLVMALFASIPSMAEVEGASVLQEPPKRSVCRKRATSR